MQISIALTNGNESECPCGCGSSRSTVWGFLQEAGVKRGVYYFQWTRARAQAEHRALAAISIGEWGEGSGAEDRIIAAFRLDTDTLPVVVRPIAPASTPWGDKAYHGRHVSPEHAAAPMSSKVRAMLNHVLEHDSRLRALAPAALSADAQRWWEYA